MASGGEEPPASPPRDILEDSKEDASKVLTFYQAMDKSVLANHPTLSIFKQGELDATMAQALTGAYYSYWTMEKITDLNNVVDKTAGCSDKLKQVFGSGASRVARIRANKIGQIVFDAVKALSDAGVGANMHAAAPAEAMAFQPAAAAATDPTPPATTAQQPKQMLADVPLIRYVFNSELPSDAVLRVRSEPSMAGEVVGTVKEDDIIMGSPSVTCDDYVRVQIRGWPNEAWMLTAMGGTRLLIPETQAAAEASARPQSARPPSAAAPVPQQMPTQMYQAPPTQQQPVTPGPGMGQPTVSASIRGTTFDPLMASQQQMLSMSMMQQPDMMGNMDGQAVPYELYRRLEMRVNRLEQELNNLKMALRSV